MSNAHAALKQVIGELEAQAYRRGWDEAMALIRKASQKNDGDLFANPIQRESQQDQSIIQMVREIINTTPGLTGMQIIEKAVEKDSNAHERTIRTALRRLRIRGIIKQDNNRWFMMVQQQRECV